MGRDRYLVSPVRRRGITALAVAGAAVGSMFFGGVAGAAPQQPTVVADQANAGSIAQARTQAQGTIVTVTGTATTPSGVFESSFYDQGFGLQAGNSGIYISDAENAGIAVGDRVEVTGKIGDKNGLLVIYPTAITKLGSGVPVTPKRLPVAAIGENTEGRLVTVSGTVSGPVFDDLPYGYKIPVSGPGGSTVIFVNTQTGIDVGAVAVGERITVTGFSGQYDATYEVLPRSAADVQQGFSLGS